MKQYLDLGKKIFEEGNRKGDRTGTGTRSIFGTQLRFNLNEGFPLLTTKSVAIRALVHELLWFLKGDTNIQYLKDNGVKIWDEWATEDGELGPIYSEQWVAWKKIDENLIHEKLDEVQAMIENGASSQEVYDAISGIREVLANPTEINQIQGVIDDLTNNPNSRRILVTAWNPAVMPDDKVSPQQNVLNGKAALPACHTLFQFYTRPMCVDERLTTYPDNATVMDIVERSDETKPGFISDEEAAEMLDAAGIPKYALSCQLYQRSADYFLGVPFNIASYALLTHMIAQCVGMAVDELIWVGGDTHVYNNHHEGYHEQISRTPGKLPKLKLNPEVTDIFSFTIDDIEVVDYVHQGKISFQVSV